MTFKKTFLLILSIAGFFDSSYLTILHYKNVIPPCAIAKGCETVLVSQFSTIFGIPVALLGAFYFLFLIFVLLSGKFPRYFKFFAFLGVLASIYFFFTQAFILHAFCQYCLLSEVIILAIFILSFRYKE
ncbi:MAG: vitamin K epoxide reductase family protein [Candidatus Levybacteria bacterium]|nr:vitamin K epoxide reductase family protein [Candidatus Levybacteria bacterium]